MSGRGSGGEGGRRGKKRKGKGGGDVRAAFL